MPKARTKPILKKPTNELTSNPRSCRKAAMNSTTNIVKRRFASRFRVVISTAGRETDALMLSKRNTTNAAASIASGSPKALAGLLEAPVYTKPARWRGFDVPTVLLSGHHAAIAAWRAGLGFGGRPESASVTGRRERV